MPRALALCLLCSALARAQYVTAAGEQLLRDGEPVRLWGVHLAAGISAPPPERGKRLAERLEAVGFNAVAFWGDPLALDAIAQSQGRPLGRQGDGSPVDRMDRFVAELAGRNMAVFLAAAALTPVPVAGDYVGPDEGRAAWEQAVAESLLDPGRTAALGALQFFDAGLQAARLRYLRALLQHVNPYTGRAYGVEPAVAMLALADRQALCQRLFDGDAETVWHPYFREQVRRQYALWLRRRYPDEAAWRTAWGEVAVGESLAQGTVSLRVGIEPCPRLSDLMAFALEAQTSWYRHQTATIRRLAPPGTGCAVIPIVTECAAAATWYGLAGAWQGDAVATGAFWPLAPQATNLTEPLGFCGPQSGGSLELRPAGKPWVIYATGQPPPQTYRAEYPMRVAVHACLQNASAVFWHEWATALDDRGYNGAPLFDLARRGAYDMSVDNIVQAQLRVAGHLFRTGAVPPHANPATFRFGRRVIDEPDYGAGWFRTDSWLTYAATHHRHGARVAFDPDFAGLEASGGDIVTEPVPQRFEPVPGVRFDRRAQQLVVDLPSAKVAVGRFGAGLDFADGIRLTNLQTPFIAFGMVSADGRPIAHSAQVTVSAVAGVQPTGFEYNENGTIRHAGARPLRYLRVKGLVELPPRADRVVVGRTILLGPLPAREATTRLSLEGRDLVLALDLVPGG